MSKKKQKDIIDNILSGKDESTSPDMDALDCLIYRDDSDLTAEESGSKEELKEEFYEESRENITVRVWDSKAKIRIKVSPETRASISIKRIAELVMDAILKELKKE
ncbi:MAG: hypothetical protein U9P10_06660 [Thermodesulfobacteriota bacterium]|nr:hypothetical protein [Thermodesulfobacteriota bacterium]